LRNHSDDLESVYILQVFPASHFCAIVDRIPFQESMISPTDNIVLPVLYTSWWQFY
jgi:hypothetical protein